jgi:hypothetical protein
MYIIIDGTNYPCGKYRKGPDSISWPVEGIALPVSAIATYADNGMLMRVDNASDYARQTYENGILTLTNAPEPEPVTEPETPIPTEEERLTALENVMLDMMIMLI